MRSTTRILTALATATILLLIVIAVAIPYFAFVRVMEYSYKYHNVRIPRMTISEAYPHLNTGDILMHLSHLPSSSSLTHHAFFSHAAMLMREGDLVYTTESQSGQGLMPNPNRPGTDYYMTKGAASAPLLTRLKFCTDTVYVMHLSHPLDPAREQRLKATADQLHRDRYAYPTVRQALASAALGLKIPARHCFQHVAHLLDEVGLTPLNLDSGLLAESGIFQVCREVCNLVGRALPDGYYYKPPVELIYDISPPPGSSHGWPF